MLRLIGKLATLGLVVQLSGCAASGPATNSGDYCAGWNAIYVSRDDVLTDGTAGQILGHNKHGKGEGCW